MTKTTTTTKKGTKGTSKTLKPIRINKTVKEYMGSIEKTHEGLGPMILYGTLSQLCNRSVMWIAGRGSGKSITIENIPHTPNIDEIQEWDSVTPTDLATDKLREKYDTSLNVRIGDFSTFPQAHKETILTTVSKIITDRNFYRPIRIMKDSVLAIDVKNCDLSVSVAIQPVLYGIMARKNPTWESLSKDRFSKFMLLNPLRTGTNKNAPVPILPDSIVHFNDVEFNPSKLNLEDINMAYAKQVSLGRSSMYVEDYLKAYAGFCGAKEVKQSHVREFMLLFGFYLNAFNDFVYIEDLENPEKINGGAMALMYNILFIRNIFGKCTKKTICEYLNVSDKGIEKYQTELVNRGYFTTKYIGKGKTRTVEFNDGPKIKKLRDTMKRIFL